MSGAQKGKSVARKRTAPPPLSAEDIFAFMHPGLPVPAAVAPAEPAHMSAASTSTADTSSTPKKRKAPPTALVQTSAASSTSEAVPPTAAEKPTLYVSSARPKPSKKKLSEIMLEREASRAATHKASDSVSTTGELIPLVPAPVAQTIASVAACEPLQQSSTAADTNDAAATNTNTAVPLQLKNIGDESARNTSAKVAPVPSAQPEGASRHFRFADVAITPDCARCATSNDGIWHTLASHASFYSALFDVYKSRDSDGAEERWFAVLGAAGVVNGEQCHAFDWPVDTRDAAIYMRIGCIAQELVRLVAQSVLGEECAAFTQNVILPSLVYVHTLSTALCPVTLKELEKTLRFQELPSAREQVPRDLSQRLAVVQKTLSSHVATSELAQHLCTLASAPSTKMGAAFVLMPDYAIDALPARGTAERIWQGLPDNLPHPETPPPSHTTYGRNIGDFTETSSSPINLSLNRAWRSQSAPAAHIGFDSSRSLFQRHLRTDTDAFGEFMTLPQSP